MTYRCFCGWDVSKTSLHLCVLVGNAEVLHHTVTTNEVGALRRTLDEPYAGVLSAATPAEVLHCLEHTGHYCHPLLKLVAPLGLHLRLEDPLNRKRSPGRQRS